MAHQLIESGAGSFILMLMLVTATYYDLRTRLIPNTLILTAIAVGLLVRFFAGGVAGIEDGLSGMMLGLIAFLPLYLWASMGAGDVKLMAATGVFLGPRMVLLAACASLLAAGALALAYIVSNGQGLVLARRYGRMLVRVATGKKPCYMPPQANEIAGRNMPLAPAITLGVLTVVWRFGGM